MNTEQSVSMYSPVSYNSACVHCAQERMQKINIKKLISLLLVSAGVLLTIIMPPFTAYEEADDIHSSLPAFHIHDSNVSYAHADIACRIDTQSSPVPNFHRQGPLLTREYIFFLPEAPIFLFDPPPENSRLFI